MGHSMSDPGNYRTRAEIEKYQERDPIKLFSASLLEEKIVDDKLLEKMDKDIREEVERSLKFAEESPLPPPEDLFTDIYANPITPGQAK
jgi:pyruvate dehydrogenase E1 component alpha subunit